jgi:hypothetical protein
MYAQGCQALRRGWEIRGRTGFLRWDIPLETLNDTESRVGAILSLPARYLRRKPMTTHWSAWMSTFALPVLPASTLWADPHDGGP